MITTKTNYKFVFLLLILTVSQFKFAQNKPDSRIIGGDVARVAQFPYSAAIYVLTTSGTYFCGGALLNNEWVLTSANCINGATSFTIQVGSNSLSDSGTTGVKVATSTYYLHPEFNSTTLEHDIGLIKFREPISYTTYIQPITYTYDVIIPDGTAAYAIGWGQTSDEEAGLQDELRYTSVSTLSNAECQLTYGSQIKENMLCVEGNYNEGTCNGDLGSPLITYVRGYYPYHTALATFISGNGCESTDPSGFTKTAPYRSWIQNITRTL